MAYSFNDYGWYAGEVPDGTTRSTSIAPPIRTQTTEPGQDRANFSGLRWMILPYKTPAPVDPGPKPTRHITRLAFLSRFSDAEAILIDLASIGATQQAAAMRRYVNKVNAAAYIDLDRSDTRGGVQALEAATLIGVGRAAEILDGAIQTIERYRGPE